MMDSIRVKYEDGVFKPLGKPRKLKEGAIGVHVDEVPVEVTRKRPSVRSSEFFGLWKMPAFIIDTDVLIDRQK